MSRSHHPDFVYRLASSEEWCAAEETGFVPKRDIDERDGYFHLSTREQVLDTANLHFKDSTNLLVLEIPLAAVSSDVKFELAPKRGEFFPHLYADLKREHVSAAIKLDKTSAGFQFGGAL
ncbi:DUF952 domain-containing protein [Hyphococcus flavus]|uniref:DUF952 domain-containing protein n=1 Tax=Hyphococcus flavus TaxID=1866326 RepID=A0AAF0CIS6_9PROT|nr:DUF952 domain-containing protein [Hyphococcus flavus]WDI33162.1 DUF952 domain-containing protein [Hyphococcus flavus]